MTSADVQLIGRIRLQKHVPRAGSFEVYSGIIVASATHLFCDLKDRFSGKIRDDPSGHFTSGLSLSVKGDLSIDHM